MATHWQLGELLRESLNEDSTNQRTKVVYLSHELTNAAEHGLSSTKAIQALQRMEDQLGIPTDKLVKVVKQVSAKATARAKTYGVNVDFDRMPQPDKPIECIESSTEDTSADQQAANLKEESNKFIPLEPDPKLQLRILREIAGGIRSNPNFTQLLQTILEGIYRGIGMDTVVLSLLTPDRKLLKAKAVLGANHILLREQFVIPISDGQNPITNLIESCTPQWGNLTTRSGGSASLREVISIVGEGPYFAAPLMTNQKAIGIFYADRKKSSRILDQDCYDSFLHFTEQANFALSILSQS